MAQAQKPRGHRAAVPHHAGLAEVAGWLRVRAAFEMPEAELRGLRGRAWPVRRAALRAGATIRSDRPEFRRRGLALRERDLR